MTNQQKASRLNILLTDEQYALIAHAASLTGSMLSQWITQHLIDAARHEISKETTLRSASDTFNTFTTALENPVPEAAINLMARNPQWA